MKEKDLENPEKQGISASSINCPKTVTELALLTNQELIAIYNECIEAKIGQNEKFQKQLNCDFSYSEFKDYLVSRGCVYYRSGYYEADFIAENSQLKSEIAELKKQLSESTSSSEQQPIRYQPVPTEKRFKISTIVDNDVWVQWQDRMKNFPDKASALSTALLHFINNHVGSGEFEIIEKKS